MLSSFQAVPEEQVAPEYSHVATGLQVLLSFCQLWSAGAKVPAAAFHLDLRMMMKVQSLG